MEGSLFTGVFADKRLDKRCEQVFSKMVNRKSAILHKSIPERASLAGAYRFMNNREVTYELIRDRLTTSWGVKGKKILCLQDTSEANFDWHSSVLKVNDQDLGPVGNNVDVGFFMHPSLCLDMEDGYPLGFSDVLLFNRSWDKTDKEKRAYKKQEIEDKESYRWIERALESRKSLQQAEYVMFISDRESDIFEMFERLPDEKSDVLIRLYHDRMLHEKTKEIRKISDQLQPCESRTVTLPLSKSGQRKKRKAKLEVKFTPVKVARPKNAAKKEPAYAELYVIEAKEQSGSVPKGEEPVYWRLITSKKTETLEDAEECLRYYSMRWRIEEVFGLVKSQAMELEESRLSNGKALKTMAMLTLQASLKVIQLKEGRDKTEKPATIAFSEKELAFIKLLCRTLEGKTIKQKNPYPENTMAYAAWVIGRLGGWKGLYSQGPPGVRSFTWGLKAFHYQYEGFLLAKKINSF